MFTWHSRQHELHVSIGCLCPPRSIKVIQRWNWAEFAHTVDVYQSQEGWELGVSEFCREEGGPQENGEVDCTEENKSGPKTGKCSK